LICLFLGDEVQPLLCESNTSQVSNGDYGYTFRPELRAMQLCPEWTGLNRIERVITY
jgi:hypothetical protein